MTRYVYINLARESEFALHFCHPIPTMADALIHTISKKCNSIIETGDSHFKGKNNVIYFGR